MITSVHELDNQRSIERIKELELDVVRLSTKVHDAILERDDMIAKNVQLERELAKAHGSRNIKVAVDEYQAMVVVSAQEWERFQLWKKTNGL